MGWAWGGHGVGMGWARSPSIYDQPQRAALIPGKLSTPLPLQPQAAHSVSELMHVLRCAQYVGTHACAEVRTVCRSSCTCLGAHRLRVCA